MRERAACDIMLDWTIRLKEKKDLIELGATSCNIDDSNQSTMSSRAFHRVAKVYTRNSYNIVRTASCKTLASE